MDIEVPFISNGELYIRLSQDEDFVKVDFPRKIFSAKKSDFTEHMINVIDEHNHLYVINIPDQESEFFDFHQYEEFGEVKDFYIGKYYWYIIKIDGTLVYNDPNEDYNNIDPVKGVGNTKFNKIGGSGQTLIAIDEDGNLWKNIGGNPELFQITKDMNIKYASLREDDGVSAVDFNGNVYLFSSDMICQRLELADFRFIQSCHYSGNVYLIDTNYNLLFSDNYLSKNFRLIETNIISLTLLNGAIFMLTGDGNLLEVKMFSSKLSMINTNIKFDKLPGVIETDNTYFKFGKIKSARKIY